MAHTCGAVQNGGAHWVPIGYPFWCAHGVRGRPPASGFEHERSQPPKSRSDDTGRAAGEGRSASAAKVFILGGEMIFHMRTRCDASAEARPVPRANGAGSQTQPPGASGAGRAGPAQTPEQPPRLSARDDWGHSLDKRHGTLHAQQQGSQPCPSWPTW